MTLPEQKTFLPTVLPLLHQGAVAQTEVENIIPLLLLIVIT
jgi:hypothetical protein